MTGLIFLLTVTFGVWSLFASARTDTVLTDGWTADGVAVTLPHTWNAQDSADGISRVTPPAGNFAEDSVHGYGYARKAVTYRHAMPAPTEGRRYFVRCEAASTHAAVAVNGRLVGRHNGAFTAFAFEITDLLLASNNVLEVVVDNFYDSDTLPLSGDYSVQGGLYRPVHLIETAAICLDPADPLGGPGAVVTTDPKSGQVKVEPRISFARGTESNRVSVTYQVKETGECFAANEFTLKDFRHWSPEEPMVYHLSIELNSPLGNDEIELPFGFCEYELRKDGFYLNGRRRKLRGVNLHQDVESRGWALMEADEDEAIGMIREMGADAVRTAHYPQSQHLYDLCDERGLLAWIEVPITDLVGAGASYRANALREAREMVAQYRHHPSAAFWSIANEIREGWCAEGKAGTWTTLKAVGEAIRTMDGTRPLVQANFIFTQTNLNSITEGMGINSYPGWYYDEPGDITNAVPEFLADNPRFTTIALSEYGAGANVNQHENPAPRKCARAGGEWHPEEYQTLHHLVHYRAILGEARLWGSFVWQMFDSAADSRTDGPVKGINDKGLICRDHKTRKDAYWFYRANWNTEPMLHLCGKRMQTTTNSVVEVVAFANLGKAVSLSVNGKTVGSKLPDEVKSVVFKDVRLQQGDNRIEVTCGHFHDACVWKNTPLRGE